MTIEQTVARHYEHGSLETSLLDALKRAGKDLDRLTHADLAQVDEFHTGGRAATRELGQQINLPKGAHVLDIGSGLGGPARYFAAEHGWQVQGIDLTPEFVAVAQSLTKRVGLDKEASFRLGSAATLPFDDGSFDGAYMIHVGMNITDKKSLFADVRRVLKPGGIFAIFDVMRVSDGEFLYPVPWSSEASTNQIASPDAYRAALAAAGFTITQERNRLAFAQQQRAAQAQQPGAGPPVFMGSGAPQKVANMTELMKRGVMAPIEIVARRA
jgi:ubiquinone/menaquinone biosynthesis C-methylase UbiE